MDLKFTKFNGTHGLLDYEAFRKSVDEKLQSTCYEAELIVLNNFPVAVSPHNSIDLLIFLHIPKKPNNYYRVEIEDDRVNVHNQIIAISIINDFYHSDIEVSSNEVDIDGILYDFHSDASKMKWGLTNYLAKACGMERNKITVHPIFWINSAKTTETADNVVISNKLTYGLVENTIQRNYFFKYNGYSKWDEPYSLFEANIRQVLDQASKDSELGYITLEKIKRIQEKFSEAHNKAYELIGKRLVEVKGKAGTGKSSDLLKWMLRRSTDGHRGVFLTYNHLLVNDIAYQVNAFNNKISQEDRDKKASTTVNTLHSFMYNVAKKLGILILLTEERINQLMLIHDKRMETVSAFIQGKLGQESQLSLAKLKYFIQNWSADEGTKREGVSLVRFLETNMRFLTQNDNLTALIKIRREDLLKRLSASLQSEIFLRDYYKVLENIILAITNLDAFLKKFEVERKYDLLALVMNLSSDLKNPGTGRMDYEKIKKRYKKGIQGFPAGRTLFVDEGQDCHPYEKVIFFNLFKSENVVVANGGKEQLIRHSELCNWNILSNRVVETYRYSKKNRSFRLKPAIAKLANYIADSYGIDLNIEPIETEDHGTIYIDSAYSIDRQVSHIETLLDNGYRNGCTTYEGVIMLTPASAKNDGSSEKDFKVSEFDNVVSEDKLQLDEWGLVELASEKLKEVNFWDVTGNIDKREMAQPGSLSLRAIYYESCRGLEAWSIMCFELDRFFDQKVKEPEADNFLLNDLFDVLTVDQRKEMYAATWVLMAVTRAIDGVYINFSNLKNSIEKVVREFAAEYPDYVTYLR